MTADKIFPVPENYKNSAYVTKEVYEDLCQQAETDSEKFWDKIGKRVDWIKPYSKIKESHFQNPVYMEIDLEAFLLVYFPKSILDNLDENQNLRQIFSKIILSSSKDGFHLEFGLKQKDKNALLQLLEAIMKNKTLENYL